MTRPLSKHRQEIENLQRLFAQEAAWRKSAEAKVAKLEEEARGLKAEVRHWENRALDAEGSFAEARRLWNQWVEADKGGSPDGKEAFVTFDPEVFKQLLSLLRP